MGGKKFFFWVPSGWTSGTYCTAHGLDKPLANALRHQLIHCQKHVPHQFGLWNIWRFCVRHSIVSTSNQQSNTFSLHYDHLLNSVCIFCFHLWIQNFFFVVSPVNATTLLFHFLFSSVSDTCRCHWWNGERERKIKDLSGKAKTERGDKLSKRWWEMCKNMAFK